MKLIEKENMAKNGTCKPFITALQPLELSKHHTSEFGVIGGCSAAAGS
jgi:hypothetical protein